MIGVNLPETVLETYPTFPPPPPSLPPSPPLPPPSPQILNISPPPLQPLPNPPQVDDAIAQVAHGRTWVRDDLKANKDTNGPIFTSLQSSPDRSELFDLPYYQLHTISDEVLDRLYLRLILGHHAPMFDCVQLEQ